MNLKTNELINLKYMMKVISIATWLMLFILAGCSDASPYAEEPSAQERTITLNLDITTRADNGTDTPEKLRLWICDGSDNLIQYIENSPTWQASSTEGIDWITSLQAKIKTKEIESLNFYLVLNDAYSSVDDASPISFINIDDIAALKNTSFVLTNYGGDNKVPMTGTKNLALNADKLEYGVLIDATRCVAKLGIYCTKGNTSSTLTIDQVTLSKVPDKGYLFEPDPDSYTSIEYTGTKNLLSITEQITVTKSYTGEMPSYFEDFWAETTTEESFEEISSPYLLENLNGNVTDDGFLQVNGSITDNDKRYCITLSYTLNGVGYTQNIYVSQIKRNQYSKIYIRINDAITVDDICCQVNSWTEHTMDVPPFE